MEPMGEIGGADMLHRIQPEAIHAGGFQIPSSPPVQLLDNPRGVHIQIGPHKVVVIAVFTVYLAVPVLALKLIDRRNVVLVVPVHPVKAGPIPLEIRILAPAARDRKSVV